MLQRFNFSGSRGGPSMLPPHANTEGMTLGIFSCFFLGGGILHRMQHTSLSYVSLLAAGICAFCAAQPCKATGIFIRDLAADIIKGVAVQGLSKALTDAITDKSHMPVDKMPVLELSWQVSKLNEKFHSAKIAHGQTQWGQTHREIFTRSYNGERTQHFRTERKDHENPQGIVDNFPFDPIYIGNFKFECRDKRTEHLEFVTKIEVSATVELYLKAKNFNVPETARGLTCQVSVTEQPAVLDCTQQAGPEIIRVRQANVRWNAFATLPGVPAQSHVLLAVKDRFFFAWE